MTTSIEIDHANIAHIKHSIYFAASPSLWPFYSHPYNGYFLPGCGFKRKGGQVRFTPQQTQSLERRFANHKYLSPEDRKQLAAQLKLTDRQVGPTLSGRHPNDTHFHDLPTLFLFRCRSKHGFRIDVPNGVAAKHHIQPMKEIMSHQSTHWI